MKYGFLFLTSAFLFLLLAMRYGSYAWLLVWPAVVYAWVGLGYLAIGPRVFGKQPDGTIPVPVAVALAPFFVYLWTVWWIMRWVQSEPATHELVPDILMSRRLRRGEIPAGVSLVVDLTCEFPATPTIRNGRTYLLFPILDAFVPRRAAMLDLIETILAHHGRTLIHCAEGHGRTGMVAAALLIRLGVVSEPMEAIKLVRLKRPGVRLRSPQIKLLREISDELRARAARPDLPV